VERRHRRAVGSRLSNGDAKRSWALFVAFYSVLVMAGGAGGCQAITSPSGVSEQRRHALAAAAGAFFRYRGAFSLLKRGVTVMARGAKRAQAA